MPTLDWLNREDAFRTAQRVPTRVLRPHAAAQQVGDAASGNLLIQGDNLEALKALLPFYRGRVKCIFIDPPYASSRTRPALNKAYAHVTEEQTGMAANALADRLIDSMGFDPLDMASMIAPQLPLDLPGGDGPLFDGLPKFLPLPALSVDLPAGKDLPPTVAEAIAQGQASLSTNGQRQRVIIKGAVAEALAGELTQAQRGKQREQVELNLLAEPVSLAGFSMVEQPLQREVYLDGQKVRVGRGDASQLPLDAVRGTITREDLARWLCKELQHPLRNTAVDVLPAHLRAFVLAALDNLVHSQRIPLEQLARHQYPLVQRLAQHIAELRDKAAKIAFQQLVLDKGWAVEAGAAHAFRFDPACYPVAANKRYLGKFNFAKHFYPVLSDLTDGSEEWHCAMALEHHPLVVRWARNLDSDPVAGFWLPTSFGRFYPDFVCELTDGRLFVAEYKGAHLRALPKEIEKGQVGQVWAEASKGQCVFAMLFKQESGLNLMQQIDKALRNSA